MSTKIQPLAAVGLASAAVTAAIIAVASGRSPGVLAVVIALLVGTVALLAIALWAGLRRAALREWQLRERIKEQRCLSTISSALDHSDEPLETVLPRVLDLVPHGWQHPTLVHARLAVGGETYESAGFRESEWSQTAMVSAGGEPIGLLEVFLVEDPMRAGDPVFLDEEQTLLDAIAERIGGRLRRQQAERTLHESAERLHQAQKLEAIGRLAGGIAHDFNNLLTGIQGFTRLALDALPGDATARDDLEHVLRSAARAAELTNQLLAFSRKQVVERRIVDPCEAIRELDRMLRRLIGEDYEIETSLAPDTGAILLEPGQLEQIVLNLGLNARDAMPGGGCLRITTERCQVSAAEATRNRKEVEPGPYVRLSVGDTGAGMDADTVARVFEPFFTTKELGRGTGLGLSTVYGIVRQAGGCVHVDSSPGVGTIVRVLLPRVANAAAAGTREEASGAHRGSESVLLVEDDDTVRALARRVLDRRGYHVIEASNGAEALRIAMTSTERIDLVLSDVVMPELGGGELARRLRELRPDLPVLLMSGYTGDAIVRQGVIDAGDLFLEKPFTPEVLAGRVRRALDGPRRAPL